MVDGYEKMNAECAVVDVDGTVIRGNSMREMMRFMLTDGVASGNLPVAAKVARHLLLRRLRVITHREMKHPIHLLALSFMADSDRMRRFMARLMTKIHPGVMSLLTDLKRRGVKLLLATAAPDIYVAALAEALGADGYTATPHASTLEGYIENRGEEKLVRAQRYAADRGWRIGCVVTDHKDDMPLLLLQGVRRVLVAPDSALCHHLREAHLDYEVIP